MRKLAAIAIVLGFWACLAHAQDFTPNLSLCKPTSGMSAAQWASCNRSSMDKLDFDFAAPLVFDSSTKEISCPTCAGGAGTVGVTGGGTGLTTVALGQILYGSASNTYSLLAGNTTTTPKYLRQVGNGTVSAAPVWTQLAAEDFAAQTATHFLAGPTPSFRAIADADVPNDITVTLAATATALAANPADCASGTVAIGITANGTATCATIDAVGFADQAANRVLAGPSTGADDAPTFRALVDADVPDTITLTNITQIGTRAISSLTGSCTIAQGCTGFTTYTLGNIIYSSATDTLARLAGNTTTTKKFLSQTGNGTVSAAPAWETIVDGDVPDTITLDNVTQITARDIFNLTGTTLPGTVVSSSLTTVGALGSGSIAAGFGVIDNGTDNLSAGTFKPAVDARTIVDDGAGTAAVLTLEPTTTYVRLTCNDANGCDITMSEASAADGDLLIVSCASTNASNFADTSGVSELTAAFACGQYDSISMIYASDRWVETARANN